MWFWGYVWGALRCFGTCLGVFVVGFVWEFWFLGLLVLGALLGDCMPEKKDTTSPRSSNFIHGNCSYAHTLYKLITIFETSPEYASKMHNAVEAIE